MPPQQNNHASRVPYLTYTPLPQYPPQATTSTSTLLPPSQQQSSPQGASARPEPAIIQLLRLLRAMMPPQETPPQGSASGSAPAPSQPCLSPSNILSPTPIQPHLAVAAMLTRLQSMSSASKNNAASNNNAGPSGAGPVGLLAQLQKEFSLSNNNAGPSGAGIPGAGFAGVRGTVMRLFDEENMRLVAAGKEPVPVETVRGIMDNLTQADADKISAALPDDEPSQAADPQGKGNGKGKAKEGDRTKESRQPPAPSWKETALGHIKAFVELAPHLAGKGNEESCTFCIYECDYGISNEATWLPAEAVIGFCEVCCDKCNSFATLFQEMVSDGRIGKGLEPARLQELKDLTMESPLAKYNRENINVPEKKKKSKIDGRDITPFQGIHFCQSSPYRQVDISKVTICKSCRSEKYAIMRHRHESFILISSIEIPLGQVSAAEFENPAKLKRCMVCTGTATHKCENCPLRVCGECHTFLSTLCKGYLDNLFYHYDRHHIRNDAFLLRTDLDPKELKYDATKAPVVRKV